MTSQLAESSCVSRFAVRNDILGGKSLIFKIKQSRKTFAMALEKILSSTLDSSASENLPSKFRIMLRPALPNTMTRVEERT